MPRYDVRCRTCGDTFELTRSITRLDEPALCPAGHDDTVRLLPAVGVTRAGTSSGPATGASSSVPRVAGAAAEVAVADRILHVALRSDWAEAIESGAYTVSSRGRTLAEEGFIHASTQEQAGPVLARFYADLDPDDLVLLVLDVGLHDAAGSPIRWDEVPFSDAPFPHVYGPIVPDAVTATLPLAGTRGAPELPDLTGHDVVLTSAPLARPEPENQLRS